MKKVLWIIIAVLLIAAVVLGVKSFSNKPAVANPATSEDYLNIIEAVKSSGGAIIATGEQGDIIVKVAATPEMIAVAGRDKNAMFLSTENPLQYAQDGYILINIIPFNTMIENNFDAILERGCFYRVMGQDTKDYSNMYAVEVCER